jgi:Uma2 family endonuclease
MSQMVQTPVRQITLAEFLALPDTKPASEYIDGKVSQKPMPQGKHSIIQIELGMEINQALRRAGIATAFSELRCTFGGRSIVPDLVVVEDANIPSDENGDIENIFSGSIHICHNSSPKLLVTLTNEKIDPQFISIVNILLA